MIDLPCITIDNDEKDYIIISYTPSETLVPFDLNKLAIEVNTIPEGKGVVLSCNSEKSFDWLNSYLAIEYAKVADWVAIAEGDVAVIVFSVNDAYRVGEIIDL
ncbi:MAG: hypothetical protein J7L15_05695 [Clostridiales bacterium]|nr:hypothetical protein [Clostridiales bacterium]